MKDTEILIIGGLLAGGYFLYSQMQKEENKEPSSRDDTLGKILGDVSSVVAAGISTTAEYIVDGLDGVANIPADIVVKTEEVTAELYPSYCNYGSFFGLDPARKAACEAYKANKLIQDSQGLTPEEEQAYMDVWGGLVSEETLMGDSLVGELPEKATDVPVLVTGNVSVITPPETMLELQEPLKILPVEGYEGALPVIEYPAGTQLTKIEYDIIKSESVVPVTSVPEYVQKSSGFTSSSAGSTTYTARPAPSGTTVYRRY